MTLDQPTTLARDRDARTINGYVHWREWGRGRALKHRTVRRRENTAVTGTYDLALLNPGYCTTGVGADRREGFVGSRRRLGDHNLRVIENLSAADRDIAGGDLNPTRCI
jgi:hypothetical protein